MRIRIPFLVSLIVLLSAVGSSCRFGGSFSVEKNDLEAGDGLSGNIADNCKNDPSKCRVTFLAQTGQLPPSSCLELWNSAGTENVIAFDEQGNQYQREFSVVRGPDTEFSFKAFKDLFYTPPASPSGSRSYKLSSFENLVLEVQKKSNDSGAKIQWQDMPIGIRPSEPTRPVIPKLFAVKYTNKLLGGLEEWVIYKSSAPWIDSDEFRPLFDKVPSGIVKDLVRSSVGMCVPVSSFAAANRTQHINLHSAVKVYLEGKSAQSDVQKLDLLYNGMLTFVEAAPGTGEVSKIYKGCYLKTQSCARALVFSAASFQGYFLMTPFGSMEKLGRGVYVFVRLTSATAAITDGTVDVVEAYNFYQTGRPLSALIRGGAAILRFRAGTGFVLEAQNAFNQIPQNGFVE